MAELGLQWVPLKESPADGTFGGQLLINLEYHLAASKDDIPKGNTGQEPEPC